jgi:4-hydroxy-tetrahydrodipicolinate reductase
MKILISGYGKMGLEIEKMALARGHEIIGRADNEAEWDEFEAARIKTDIVVDFSQPKFAVRNIERCINAGWPIVVGTTGWYDHLEDITNLCSNKNGAVFYAPNFSPGVNIFFNLNAELSQFMSKMSDYEVRINEVHHIHKLDSPSGTSIKTAEDIIRYSGRYNKWSEGQGKGSSEISIFASRLNEVPGIHEVIWESEADQIMIRHEAKNRRGFAIGALLAAEFLIGRKGIFTMKDLLKSMF